MKPQPDNTNDKQPRMQNLDCLLSKLSQATPTQIRSLEAKVHDCAHHVTAGMRRIFRQRRHKHLEGLLCVIIPIRLRFHLPGRAPTGRPSTGIPWAVGDDESGTVSVLCLLAPAPRDVICQVIAREILHVLYGRLEPRVHLPHGALATQGQDQSPRLQQEEDWVREMRAQLGLGDQGLENWQAAFEQGGDKWSEVYYRRKASDRQQRQNAARQKRHFGLTKDTLPLRPTALRPSLRW